MKLSLKCLAASVVTTTAFLFMAAVGSHAADNMPNGIPPMPTHTMQDHGEIQHGHGAPSGQIGAVMPTMPGQDAFGTVQEIVKILEADPTTDWSKVRFGILREHLIDMNEVVLKAHATEKTIDHGLQIAITGSGRTLDAIQRMVPAHAYELNQLNGWKAGAERLSNGIRLTVTSDDPKQVEHIRGLGFIGLMASGAHHQQHHLAMAKGNFSH